MALGIPSASFHLHFLLTPENEAEIVVTVDFKFGVESDGRTSGT
jgi:hypothetical protein